MSAGAVANDRVGRAASHSPAHLFYDYYIILGQVMAANVVLRALLI